ncbi:homoprotocatechuate degradation regulator HpaR [Sulfitobacter undariae]|uniref:Homoprotocatechuate degradation regulator HpaR n=1 Tax=Sulfitobacter undariae TaxID=1563671 RepID=A0A7W6E5A1_9RHOB|nr:homoprotocatechuate degradation operon regulator HpaR [Sulfitobacter undariae]MBB3995002.1 homoprotocatechuate degradation regulator HpaR [Sulfitobacter undariae]
MTSEHISKPTVTALRRTNRSLPIALLRARETVMGPIRDMLADSPVNEQKWRVLRVLEENGPQDQNSIAREACLLLPSLTRILRTMEAEGLVTRRVASDDRRRSIVSIEAAGLAILQDHSVQASALVDRLRAQYGEEKLEQLLDLLEDLQVAEEKR